VKVWAVARSRRRGKSKDQYRGLSASVEMTGVSGGCGRARATTTANAEADPFGMTARKSTATATPKATATATAKPIQGSLRFGRDDEGLVGARESKSKGRIKCRSEGWSYWRARRLLSLARAWEDSGELGKRWMRARSSRSAATFWWVAMRASALWRWEAGILALSG